MNTQWIAPLIFVSVFAAALTPSGALELNCRLEWVDYHSGNPLPEKAVASHPDEFYVARIFNKKSDSYEIGSLETTTGLAFIGSLAYTSFQVLTNPHGCLTEWVQPPPDRFSNWKPVHAYPIGPFGTGFDQNLIARVNLTSKSIACSADIKSSKLAIGDQFLTSLPKGTKPPGFETCQILRSYSLGLELTYSDVNATFEMPSVDNVYIGEDEIQNDSDAELTVLITHSKRIQERFLFQHKNPNDFIFGAGLYFYLTFTIWPLPPILLKLELMLNATLTLGFETNAVYEQYAFREHVVEKRVTVPPRQGVKVCSASRVVNTMKIGVSATRKISGKGMSGNEVYRFLRHRVPEFQGEIEGDYVVAAPNKTNSTGGKGTEGMIIVSTAIGTEFTVLPLDSMVDCGYESENTEGQLKKQWDDIVQGMKSDMDEGLSRNKNPAPKHLAYKPEVRDEPKNYGVVAKGAKFKWRHL